MKLVALAVLISIGCGSKSEPSGSGSAAVAERPSVTDPIGFCARARMMLMGRKKCFPEDVSIKMGLEAIAEHEGHAPADPAGRRRVAAECAVMLQGMMRAEQPKNCPLDVTETESAELTAFLDAWYGERTAAPTTGHADADAALVKLAGERDAACACKDLTCVRPISDALDPAMPSGAPAAATEAAAKMADEVTRCRHKLANIVR